jgi:branched-chain amino acid aminotransferase
MDHGFLYGDSVYETVRTYRGELFLLDRHLDRLQRSLERIFLSLPVSRKELEQEIDRTVRSVPFKDEIMLRIVVSRGVGPIGLDVGLCHEPRYMIYAIDLSGLIPPQSDPSFQGELLGNADGNAGGNADRNAGGDGDAKGERGRVDGVRVVISKIRRNSPRALDPSIKSGNFLNNILAFKEARDAGAHEALLCTADGYLAEGTTANVFVVKDGFIWTPRSWGILDGITRAVLFEEAEAAGIPIGETNIPPEALFTADEVLITSSVKGVVPVGCVNDRPVGAVVRGGVGQRGPITLQLQKLYHTRMEKECAASAAARAENGSAPEPPSKPAQQASASRTA